MTILAILLLTWNSVLTVITVILLITHREQKKSNLAAMLLALLHIFVIYNLM